MYGSTVHSCCKSHPISDCAKQFIDFPMSSRFVLSLNVRLKHTVLPYNYLYMYACLCARAAWCRERLNTSRKKLFTARLGPKTRLGAKVSWLVLLQKVQSKYRYGGWCQYCTVEIPTEMEFTGTFQNYLQCTNRTWFSNVRKCMLKPYVELYM